MSATLGAPPGSAPAQEGVVHDKPSPVTVRSLTYAELSALHKRDYDKVLRRFPFLRSLVEHHSDKVR